MIEFNISSTEVTRFSISGKILSDADILPMRNELENIVNWKIILDLSMLTHTNSSGIAFMVKILTKSRINELKTYGTLTINQRIGVPVISNGQIWGAITDVTSIYTAYTVNTVNYYDYIDGTTIYFEQSSGLTSNNLTAVPITKDEVLLKVIDQAQVQTNVFVERGKNSAYERIQRLGEVDNLGDMINYGYGFFNVINKEN